MELFGKSDGLKRNRIYLKQSVCNLSHWMSATFTKCEKILNKQVKCKWTQNKMCLHIHVFPWRWKISLHSFWQTGVHLLFGSTVFKRSPHSQPAKITANIYFVKIVLTTPNLLGRFKYRWKYMEIQNGYRRWCKSVQMQTHPDTLKWTRSFEWTVAMCE